MIRRLCIWGGPGSGKSATSSWLFSNLKILGYDIQFVEEFVKRWAFQKKPILSFDQLYISASQITLEDELLRSGVKYIITECPCMLTYVYAKRNKLNYAPQILEVCRQVEEIYPSINIYLYRDVDYKIEGRYETEAEAKQFDEELLSFLKSEYEKMIIASPKDKERILLKLNDALR